MSILDKFRKKQPKNVVVVKQRSARAQALDLNQFPLSSFSANDFLRLPVDELRRRAADLLWSSPHAMGAMSQLSILVLGTGLRLQSVPNRNVLGKTSKEVQEVAREFESYFELVRDQNECSHDEQRTFNELEIQAFWSFLIWDEYFLVFRYRDINSLVPVSIEVLNPGCVKNPTTSAYLVPEGHTVDGGIETNRKGRKVAFWYEYKEDGAFKFERIRFKARNGKRIGIHKYKAKLPKQNRGTTRFLPVFHEMERMQEGLQHETDTMAVNARLAAVFERDRFVQNPDKFEEIVNAGGDLSEIDFDVFSGNPGVSQRVSQSGGIIVQSTEPGEKLTPFDSKRPNVNINEFILSNMTWIGPVLGIPVELWRALFGKAYSASKGSIDLGYKSFEQEAYFFSRGFEQPYYEEIMSAFVGAGRLSIVGWRDEFEKAAYLQAKWNGPPKPSLNPLQEEKAVTERVNNNRSYLDRETELNSGLSFDVVADRKDYEIERLQERSVDPETLEA